jgi:hypothetical protein
VRDAAKHSEFGVSVEPKALAHPREEVREAEVAPLYAFGDPSAPCREGKRPNAVWAQGYVGVRGAEVGVRLEDILSVDAAPTEYFAAGKNFHRRNLHADLEIGGKVFSDSGADHSGTLEHHEPARLRDLEVENLSRRRIGRIWSPC